MVILRFIRFSRIVRGWLNIRGNDHFAQIARAMGQRMSQDERFLTNPIVLHTERNWMLAQAAVRNTR